jgi:hypothetical protein
VVTGIGWVLYSVPSVAGLSAALSSRIMQLSEFMVGGGVVGGRDGLPVILALYIDPVFGMVHRPMFRYGT